MKDRKIKFACPACQRKLKLGDSHLDKPIVCPKCNTRFRINRSMVAEIAGRGTGPRSQVAQQDQESIGEFAVAQGAFEDIDSLFGSGEVHAHVRQIEVHASRPITAAGDSASVDAQERKQNASLAPSKADEKLGRNGVGLLILAAGFALLPWFAASVPELAGVLPYLPLSALALAVIGTFALAYSKRRRSFATIILSLFPLLFIGLAATGSHLYLKYVGSLDTATSNQPPEPAQQQPHHGDVVDDDRITIDRDSINQNPAAKFVPPRHDDNPPGDHRPSLLASTESPSAEASDESDSEFDWTNEATEDLDERPEINSAPVQPTRKNDMPPDPVRDKREILLGRIDSDQMRLLVSHGNFRNPDDNDDYSFSRIAGKSTVYGVVFKTQSTVRGFDSVTSANNPTFELIVPLVDKPQFPDSQFADGEGGRLAGMNVYSEEIGITGLQGIFTAADGERLGDWIGTAPDSDNYVTLRVERGLLSGFVMYRNGLRIVGFGLVTRN